MTCASLRDLVIDACGFDPGFLEPHTRLDDAALSGLMRFRLVAALEARYGIEFPADLLGAIETVDDLVHFTEVKRSQR